MARIDALPSIDIIRGFKGILDFYLWKGLPCVRAWPRGHHLHRSDAEIASALLFGAVIKAFSLTHGAVLDQLAPETVGIPRTARDIYVSGVYGNLHEASMSDFLTLLTECRDFLSNLTALLNALDSIDTDELVVNVDQSVLPASAATDAHQLTQITALQKLDDLQDALQSKGLDRLIVRGENQLFSFLASLLDRSSGNPSGAGGYRDSGTPLAGQIWHVTNITAWDGNTPLTAVRFYQRSGGVNYCIDHVVAAIPATQWTPCACDLYLHPGNVVRVDYVGCLAGDTCIVDVLGYRMTFET